MANSGQIEFLQFHLPSLQSGEYEINVKQDISSTNGRIPAKSFTIDTKKFYVSGERFSLKPEDIHSVFPPDGSLGDHANVLPHIILARNTLPWERESVPLTAAETKKLQAIKKKSRAGTILTKSEENLVQKKAAPWLALLVFYDDEKLSSQNLKISELNSSPVSKTNATVPLFPKVVQMNDRNNYSEPILKLEFGQSNEDRVRVVDVKLNTLRNILPTANDLKYTAHARQLKDADGTIDASQEMAVILGNRLPKAGGMTTVHLVSLEHCFNSNGFIYENQPDDKYIRLITLKSWSFSCIDHKQSFTNLLKHLNGYSADPRNPEVFLGQESNTLRLPNSADADVEKYFRMGHVPLSHQLRNGQKTISWYHGPLATGEPKTALNLPAKASDELLIYNNTTGLFDISYAAAWELGRLMALQSKSFSLSLFKWKRTHAQRICKTEQSLLHTHLPIITQIMNTDLPLEIISWFKRLSLLHGVPFDYLISNERMLPQESIRFFKVDTLWIECLLDGAFSIGRVTSADHHLDSRHRENPAANPHPVISGFLLRSDVVSGWPGLQIDGYKELISQNDLVPKKQFLFDLAVKFESELANNELSLGLRAIFQTNQKALSKQAKVSTSEKGKWLIIDNTTHFRYLIQKNKTKLEVYEEHTLQILRMERLSENVLICMFDGNVKTIDIHQKPETLHFGFDINDFSKQPRNHLGEQTDLVTDKIESDVWHEANNKVNINNLAQALQSKPLGFTSGFTSAEFALAMIEGAEKVRFKKKAGN